MISLIVAMDENRLIGKDNSLPWHIKEDMLHFKNYTMGKKVIMGAATFYSIGKPLVGRTNYVCCNDAPFNENGTIVVTDLFSILNEYKDKDEELVVIGGKTIYELSLPYVDLMVVSRIKKAYEGNIYFPDFESDFCVEKINEGNEIDVYYYRRNK